MLVGIAADHGGYELKEVIKTFLLANKYEVEDFGAHTLNEQDDYPDLIVPLALAYVGIFMLSFQTSGGKKILSLLAPVGKMAFSNYIMQSLIGNFVFLGAGLGYMGTVGPVYYTLFGIAIFIVQIIISTIWLKYFNYGPLEWLWRSATYKKWQRLKKTQIVSA